MNVIIPLSKISRLIATIKDDGILLSQDFSGIRGEWVDPDWFLKYINPHHITIVSCELAVFFAAMRRLEKLLVLR